MSQKRKKLFFPIVLDSKYKLKIMVAKVKIKKIQREKGHTMRKYYKGPFFLVGAILL